MAASPPSKTLGGFFVPLVVVRRTAVENGVVRTVGHEMEPLERLLTHAGKNVVEDVEVSAAGLLVRHARLFVEIVRDSCADGVVVARQRASQCTCRSGSSLWLAVVAALPKASSMLFMAKRMTS